MSSADRDTLDRYDADAETYADRFALPADDPVLRAFIAAMRPGARVLDLGCGAGHAAAAMRDAGLDPVALDASPGMARVARARHGLSVITGPFEELPVLGHFAGIWAMFSLVHARRVDLPRHLAAIRTALSPDGVAVIGMKTAPAEGAPIPAGGEARDGLGRLYCYVPQDELHALLVAAGLSPRETKRGATAGFDGVVAPWVIVTADG